MSAFRLLFVEDTPGDLKLYQETVTRYAKEKGREIEFVDYKTLEEALDKIDNSFDGAIIDLKLGHEADAGNRVIREIHDKYRIPVAILTGTPGNADSAFSEIIKVYKKGESGLDEILGDLLKIYDTGLTRIFGGRGHIEDTMNKVFWNNIIPQLDSWKSHVECGENTEKALLRFIMNHLLEHLDDVSDCCLPEEMYIFPPVSLQIKTGGIVKKKNSNDYYVVLSPACDLACHDGQIKTNRILVCMIENYDISLLRTAKRNINLQISKGDDEPTKSEKGTKIKNAEFIFTRLPQNNYSNFYHYLPQTTKFKGGIIDFRKIETYNPSEFSSKFDKPFVQISMAFTKDIVSRFSSYYARQGQPDFDFDMLANKLKDCIPD
jgi:hypothetical protein